MEELSKKFAKELEAKMFDAVAGPVKAQPQRAITVRHGRFETVNLDAAGNIVEPPPRCCYGVALHAPNCKFWLTCT